MKTMRSWAPFLGERQMVVRHSLGAVSVGTEDEIKIQDDFIAAWMGARTIQARAQVEQDFLKKAGAIASTLETDLNTALAQDPKPLGFLVTLADDNVRTGRAYSMASFISNAGNRVPRGQNEPFPVSPVVGLPWTIPADALVSRFDVIRQRAKAEIDREMKAFLDRPWEPTPRVAPQEAIPRPGEEQLPSGESGRRPSTIFDDLWQVVKKYWWVAAALGGGYLLYSTLSSGAAATLACLRPDGLYDLYDADTLARLDTRVSKGNLPSGASIACPAKRRS